MTIEQLEKAKEIESEIKTLEVECISLSPNWKTDKTSPRFIRKLIGKPSKKNHTHYYCTDDLSIIGDKIIVRPDEIDVLREYKLQKIEQLKQKLMKTIVK